jgi:signal transduction histidine kinase
MWVKPTISQWDEPPDLLRSGPDITEYAPLPMVTLGGTGHIVRCVNAAFCRLIDRPREEIVGKSFGEIMPQNDKCVTLLDRVFQTGEPESHTEQKPSKSHPVFWAYTMWPVRANARPVGVVLQVTETVQFHEQTLAMNEALVLGSVRQHELTEVSDRLNAKLHQEITERKQAQQKLQLAQAQLADRAGQLEGLVGTRTSELTATNSQLEAFVHSIAHDLRAPVRAMQGFTAMLVEGAGASLNEAGRNYAERINKSAQFMDAMLIDLLAFSRISHEHVKLTPTNLKPFVESVLSRVQTDIQEKRARVESPGPWPVVLAHQPTLAQVLFNLVSNALKFVVTDVPPVVRLWAEEKGEFVRVWVEDNGPGIAPDHQDQIFKLFTRLDGEKYPGTGIGLAIVQKGVERMGGRAGVESAAGQGSRFWFELPKAPKT